ncbi:hypothetical protein BKA62DRAFT_700043 [Auriculariales sp. MPI-PUGE-AT-0066]|nr:hypothetical protein BKA62DRAFT_700043 [Auriculariales sp. MPI-PUGE-AT-0066]
MTEAAYSTLSTFADRYLPLLVFPALSAGAFSMMAPHMMGESFQKKVNVQCPLDGLGSTSYRVPYTGVFGLDKFLCDLVAFFHAAMQPEVSAFMNYTVVAGGMMFLLPFIEGSRRGAGWRNVLVAFPVVTTLLFQLATVGGSMPIWWTFFLGGAHHRMTGSDAFISRARAEAIVFAFIVGIIVPTAAMLAYDNPLTIVLWQPCPLYFYIVQQFYGSFRRQASPSSHVQSGFRIMQAFYIFLFIAAAVPHVQLLRRLYPDEGAIVSFFLAPSVPNPDASMATQALNVLQWDVLGFCVSCLLAAFWFADSLDEMQALSGYYMIALPLLGPFASFIGTLLWREWKLNGKPNGFGVLPEKQKKMKKD